MADSGNIKRFLIVFERISLALIDRITSNKLIFIILLFTIGVFTTTDQKKELINSIINHYKETLTAAFAAFALHFLYSYLDGSALRHRRRLQTGKLHETNASPIESEVKDEVERKIETATAEVLFDIINKKYLEKDYVDFYKKEVEKNINHANSRFQDQINKTNRSANVNLLVGLTTTFVAVYILAVAYFDKTTPLIHELKDLYSFAPRISLAFFIEFFSFFFLRLYKRNLEDIKYLYNERTNFDMKLIALKTSLFKPDSDSVKMVIEELVKTERNFILKKDETTVDILHMKTENENNAAALEKFISIFKLKS